MWMILRGAPDLAMALRSAGLQRGLMALLPLFVGHAVDVPASPRIVQVFALLFRRGDQPLGQAVATKPGQLHELDVLHVLAAVQMLQQATKGGCLEDIAPRGIQSLQRDRKSTRQNSSHVANTYADFR